jgi:hypothetical protein
LPAPDAWLSAAGAGGGTCGRQRCAGHGWRRPRCSRGSRRRGSKSVRRPSSSGTAETARRWCCCTGIPVRRPRGTGSRHGSWRPVTRSSARTCVATDAPEGHGSRRITRATPSAPWPVTWWPSCAASGTRGSRWPDTTAEAAWRCASCSTTPTPSREWRSWTVCR